MEMNVKFYFEPLRGRNCERRHTLLADWCCRSKEEIVSQVAGMVMGARMKYKRFRVAAYNADTGDLMHCAVNYD